MQVEFLGRFDKDVDKLQTKYVKKSLSRAIAKVESADNLQEIPNLKKLKGYQFVYPIKIGEYRIGVFVRDSTVEFARVVHRKDIYKVFP